jgi:prephenate dehydrogenase
MHIPFRRVALFGFGLMGGSLARALKGLPSAPHLTGYSQDPEELRMGMEAGLLDDAPDPGSPILQDKDLVLYATPPQVTLHLLHEHSELVGDETTLTDVVSLNRPFLQQAREVGLEERCIASHPMAGGTGSGFGHSVDDLFRGARIWLSPGTAAEERVRKVETLWGLLGADPRRIEAQAHDDMMGWVSHLPQITANTLALTLKGAGISPGDLGPGGRDATRLAGSGAGLWREILAHKPETLLTGLEAMGNHLDRLRELLAEGRLDEVEALMQETRAWLEGEE